MPVEFTVDTEQDEMRHGDSPPGCFYFDAAMKGPGCIDGHVDFAGGFISHVLHLYVTT